MFHKKYYDDVRVVGAVVGEDSVLYITRDYEDELFGVSFVRKKYMNDKKAPRMEQLLLDFKDARRLKSWLLGGMSGYFYANCHCWGEILMAVCMEGKVYFEIYRQHNKYSKRKLTDEVVLNRDDAYAFARRWEIPKEER